MQVSSFSSNTLLVVFFLLSTPEIQNYDPAAPHAPLLLRSPTTGRLLNWDVGPTVTDLDADEDVRTISLELPHNFPDDGTGAEPWYYVKPAHELPANSEGVKGLGLFAAHQFKADEVIAVYEGRPISRAQQRQLRRQGHGLHTIQLSRGKLLDGENARLLAQCANTKRGIAKRHNAAFKLSTIDRGVALLRATHPIAPNEQVLVPYGSSYYSRSVRDTFFSG